MIGAALHAARPPRPRPRSARGRDILAASAVRVAEPRDLCRLQSATRELCRAIGLGEAEVFEAVIGVSELAHRLFVETGRRGELELAAVRLDAGVGLDLRADLDGRADPVAARLSFPAGALCS